MKRDYVIITTNQELVRFQSEHAEDSWDFDLDVRDALFNCYLPNMARLIWMNGIEEIRPATAHEIEYYRLY